MVLGIFATAIAVAALVISLNKTRTPPQLTYTDAEKAVAKAELCNQYGIESSALHIETDPNGDPAFARISMINGALMLQTAASNPALDPRYRDVARILASSYLTMAAKATTGMATPEEFQQSVGDSISKNAPLKEWCGF